MRPANQIEPIWRLSALLEGFARVSADHDTSILGISNDSRLIKPGDLFLAVPGGETHGLRFTAEAFANGAAAIAYEPDLDMKVAPIRAACIPVPALSVRQGEIAARFFQYPSRTMTVFGVTGTDGKTSVSHFIAEALDEPERRCGLIGTLGYGLCGQLLPAAWTTPDAVLVQKTMADLSDGGAKALAMEVSSHALDQERVRCIDFDVAVFTNLSRDHLDYHRDVSAYAAAKKKLFTRSELTAAVVNVDDAFGRMLGGVLPSGCARIAYGRQAEAQGNDGYLRPAAAEMSEHGMRVLIESTWGETTIQSPLLGEFNAHNLMAAIGALIASGVKFSDACARIQKVNSVPGRMEAFRSEDRPLVVVDYAHTPHALGSALTSLRAHCQGRLWCVFGCGGQRDAGKRPIMGRTAERLADRIIITNDNPRAEPPEKILSDILSGLKLPEQAQIIPDRAQAIAAALACAARDDVVLIAGKGHESHQLIGDERLPFSDREQVLRLL
jgi:UDP-N-acetylmuramoyl-L-alanyl-D-glutamate--2,6-diaminopimelate ligase